MADFTLWKTLTPNDQVNFPQQIAIASNGDIYLTQASDSGAGYENLTVSRFNSAGAYVSKMTGLRGHGTPLLLEEAGGSVYLTFPFKDGSGTDWVRLLYTAGQVWTASGARAFPTNPLTENQPKATYWTQGEVVYKNVMFRLVGGPFNAKGATSTGGPAVLEVYRGGVKTGNIDASHLGRVEMVRTGAPINARLEPEGLGFTLVKGAPNLVVGIANGRADNDTLRMTLYLYPLEATVLDPVVRGGGLLDTGYTPHPPGKIAQFVICDTLTGQIVGAVQPNKWELTDPLTEPGSGTLTVPFTQASRTVLRGLTRPWTRFLAVQDTNDNIVWCGPILKDPTKSAAGEITVPVIDWRGYFWRVFLRPKSGSDNGPVNYKNTEQGTILRTLLGKMWDGALAPGSQDAKPPFQYDPALVTGVKRDFSSAVLDKSIGEYAAELSGRERGIEWWTYGVVASDTTILPRVGFAYPERKLRPNPIRLEWRDGRGGNTYDPAWPEPEEFATRVWAVGEGEPPAQPVSKDQYPELVKGTAVLVEKLLGPLSGVKKAATAFEHAAADIQQSRRQGGTAELSILEEKLLLSSYAVGDRARVVFDDGWNQADVPAGRIISRTLSGGRGQPTTQRLTVDLLDAHYPDDGKDPGEGIGTDT